MQHKILMPLRSALRRYLLLGTDFTIGDYSHKILGKEAFLATFLHIFMVILASEYFYFYWQFKEISQILHY